MQQCFGIPKNSSLRSCLALPQPVNFFCAESWILTRVRLMQAGGSQDLESLLAHEAEEATPEFLRQRPKYYYYNQWMRDRIAEHCGCDLPEPVIVKMLDMEAGELDLILTYPTAAQQQVCRGRPAL